MLIMSLFNVIINMVREGFGCYKLQPHYDTNDPYLLILSGDQQLNNIIQLQTKYSAENA